MRHIIRLPDLNALVSQDGVGRDYVEIELSQRPITGVLLARHVEDNSVWKLKRDRTLDATIESVWLNVIQKMQRFINAGFGVCERTRCLPSATAFSGYLVQPMRHGFPPKPEGCF